MLSSLWEGFSYQAHQVQGVKWMLERETKEPKGGLLCDEMGLGKTIQVLGVVKETKKTTLLIAPLCTLDQWQVTAERCGFVVWRAHDSLHEWELPDNLIPGAVNLFLVNYERAIARPNLVTQRVWPRVVFDEAHRMADPKGRSFELGESIPAKIHWFLTATPIVNSFRDVVSLFKLLGVPDDSLNEMENMAGVIRETVLCRKMEDLRDTIRSLPAEAKETKHILDFETEEEGEFYRGIQGYIQRRWKALQHEQNGQMEIFRLIMRLRQISIHPQVYIQARKDEWRSYDREDWLTPSTKFQKLKDLIESQTDKSHRWIIFCHFHHEMELLQEYLMDSCPYVREVSLYHGGMSAKDKSKALETSEEPLVGVQQEVLLVQLQSGGTGLNLQHCDRIIFMGPWWTAALMDQAIGRAVRIGQKEVVEVHHLVLKEEQSLNIDRRMLAAAEKKRALCDRFLDIAKSVRASDDPVAFDENDEPE